MDEFSPESFFKKRLDDCITSNNQVMNELNQVIRTMDISVFQVRILIEGAISSSKMAGDYIDPKNDQSLQKAIEDYMKSLNYVRDNCNTFFVGNMLLLKKLECGMYDDLMANINEYKQVFATQLSQCSEFINRIDKMKEHLNKYTK